MAMFPDISNMPKKGYFVPAMNPAQLKYGAPFGMIMPIVPQTEVSQDKILKDQNFLSSDDKLYEEIICHGLNLQNVFSECQFSEKILGSYFFKAIKKNVFDQNIIIFDDSTNVTSTNSNNTSTNNFGIKEIEILENNIIDIILDNGKIPNIPDTSHIFKRISENKNKNKE